MDVIAGRKTVGRITGNILVNGQPKDQKQWARVCGYVEQNDIHTPATTVKEALQFSARLRLPPSVTDDQVGGGALVLQRWMQPHTEVHRQGCLGLLIAVEWPALCATSRRTSPPLAPAFALLLTQTVTIT
jgi:hypothetical protein